ncbi:FAD/NAD(P)-binding protein [Streptomyces sp. NPDC002851]
MEEQNPGRSDAFQLAVVGGGPRATYALERLSATVGELNGRRLAVHVYDLAGEFGSGLVHGVDQPHTSYLNRAGAQVAFAADPTVAGADRIRDPKERPTLHEWCRHRFEITGDPAFDLEPTDSPRRRQHGLALREMFDRYVGELRRMAGVTVALHAEEVTDLVPTAGGRMDVVSTSGVQCRADQVLLITGHSSNDCSHEPGPAAYLDFSRRTGAVYVPSAYPLQEPLSPQSIAPEVTVGCAGLGLTAIDQILYLTEGRGGRFSHNRDGVRYEACGAEPAKVYAFSPSGIFPYTRPLSRKDRPHRGRFLTRDAVDRIRDASGLRAGNGERPRLDFEAHVMPLIVLEMAYVHYRTLFGPSVGDLIVAHVQGDYERFLTGPVDPAAGAGVERLLPGVDALVDIIGGTLRDVMADKRSVNEARRVVPGWDARGTLTRWLTVVFGPDVAAKVTIDDDRPSPVPVPHRSPWRLDTDPTGNRFDWQTILHPVRTRAGAAPDEFRRAYLDFLDRDLTWAHQGNRDNPFKASVDGVWRDLRQVISYAVDGGGLSGDAHRRFLEHHRRIQNKLSGGASPVVMAKIRALAKQGILDLSAGPRAMLQLDEENGKFVLHGRETSLRAALDVVLDARVHPFDASRDVRPLYRNLIQRKLARLWRNTTPGQADFVPGYLDLDERSRALGHDGRPVDAITVLGPAAAARATYQFSALRPHHNDVVMRDIVVWLDGFWAAFHGSSAPEPDAHQ